MAHKLAVRYLKRRAAAAAGAPSASGRGQRRTAPTRPQVKDPLESPGRQGTCPVCGRSAQLLRTQVLDAAGDRVDWICSRCRG